VTEDSFQVQAKGARPDEALEVTLKLPLLSPEPAAKAHPASKLAVAGARGGGLFGLKLGNFLPSFDSPGPATSGGVLPEAGGGGGHFSLRCGQMLVSAEVGRSAGGVSEDLCVQHARFTASDFA